MPKLGGRQMLHEVIERERHLQTELAGTVETLRAPAELAKSAAGLERHQRVAHREPDE
jgi:hypothetical protein